MVTRVSDPTINRDNSPPQFFDPQTNKIYQERVCGEKLIRWAYTSPLAPLLQRLIFRNHISSRILGRYFDSALSKKRIGRFAQDLNIDLDEADKPETGYQSFNDFFSRKLKPGRRPFDKASRTLVSPADCRTLVFAEGVSKTSKFSIKGMQVSLPKLLSCPPETDSRLIQPLEQGQVIISRLCPADYHRFHFPGTGKKLSHWKIPGYLNSVNPLPLRLGIRVFEENYREVSILDLENFGICAYIEVGAFGVGRIRQTHQRECFEKMDEKGYFQFGGSTIILILPPRSIQFREDLCHWSSRGTETLLKAGNTLGTAIKNK